MLTPKLSMALALCALIFFIQAPMKCSASGQVRIGPLYQCENGVRGMVFAVHDKEIKISGFDYDGKGSSVGFLGTLKGAKGVSTGVKEEYIQLASPDGVCENLKSYNNAEITISLPKSIKEFETIGIFDFEKCVNLGHVYIPQDIAYPAAVPDSKETKSCDNAKDACTIEKTKHSALHADCPVSLARHGEHNNGMIPHVDKMLIGLSVGCLLQANK